MTCSRDVTCLHRWLALLFVTSLGSVMQQSCVSMLSHCQSCHAVTVSYIWNEHQPYWKRHSEIRNWRWKMGKLLSVRNKWVTLWFIGLLIVWSEAKQTFEQCAVVVGLSGTKKPGARRVLKRFNNYCYIVPRCIGITVQTDKSLYCNVKCCFCTVF